MTINQESKLWSLENIRLGQLLLAASDMQSFVRENWTSAQKRHQNMPTSDNHWTRSQMRRSSMLAVHARPVPEGSSTNGENDSAIDICVRRNKLSKAWGLMQECGTELWTEVCHLHAMIIAVDQNPEKFAEDKALLEEVAEAKTLMQNAEILAAVEIIKSYDQEEWMNIKSTSYVKSPWASKQIHHGSLLAVHEHHHSQDPTEAKVRHAEHASAWLMMRECDKEKWAAACKFHEEYNAKREKLDRAVSIIQEFSQENWTSAHLRHKKLPASEPHWTATHIHHGATLVVRARPVPENQSKDPAYQAQREKLSEAWKIMKDAGPAEWVKACKLHEEKLREKLMKESTSPPKPTPKSNPRFSSLKLGCRFSFRTGVIRTEDPVRHGVGNHAA